MVKTFPNFPDWQELNMTLQVVNKSVCDEKNCNRAHDIPSRSLRGRCVLSSQLIVVIGLDKTYIQSYTMVWQ